MSRGSTLHRAARRSVPPADDDPWFRNGGVRGKAREGGRGLRADMPIHADRPGVRAVTAPRGARSGGAISVHTRGATAPADRCVLPWAEACPLPWAHEVEA